MWGAYRRLRRCRRDNRRRTQPGCVEATPLLFAPMARTAGEVSQTTAVGLSEAVVAPRTFAWSGSARGRRMRWFASGLRSAMLDQGYTEVGSPGPEVQVVLHFVDAA